MSTYFVDHCHLLQTNPPSITEEEARIRAAGGHVSDGRVNARLATSRSFGDFDFKTNKNTTIDDQVVTARPDVWERTVTEDDEFLILATDGTVSL